MTFEEWWIDQHGQNWSSIFTHNEKNIAEKSWNAALAIEHEVSDKLEKALRIVAQSLAWKSFGECRSFGENVLLMAPAVADKFAHITLTEVATIRKQNETVGR